MTSFDDGSSRTAARRTTAIAAKRLAHVERGNAGKGPSSVRWASFAIIAAHIRDRQGSEERQGE